MTPPLALLWKIYLYENVLFILHYKYRSDYNSNPIVFLLLQLGLESDRNECFIYGIGLQRWGSDYKSNPTVFILSGIGILPKCMFCLLISGRQDQVIIPLPIPQYLYTSWDWNLAEIHVLFIDIQRWGSDYKSNPTVFILVGIGILPKVMFYLLIYRDGHQIINPIPQYLYQQGLESFRNSCFIY